MKTVEEVQGMLKALPLWDEGEEGAVWVIHTRMDGTRGGEQRAASTFSKLWCVFEAALELKQNAMWPGDLMEIHLGITKVCKDTNMTGYEVDFTYYCSFYIRPDTGALKVDTRKVKAQLELEKQIQAPKREVTYVEKPSNLVELFFRRN